MIPLARSWTNAIDTQLLLSTMSTHHIARSITNTIRQVRRSGPRPLHLTLQRAVSTKHPKGFVPPTNDDLGELRERVHDFTRKS